MAKNPLRTGALALSLLTIPAIGSAAIRPAVSPGGDKSFEITADLPPLYPADTDTSLLKADSAAYRQFHFDSIPDIPSGHSFRHHEKSWEKWQQTDPQCNPRRAAIIPTNRCIAVADFLRSNGTCLAFKVPGNLGGERVIAFTRERLRIFKAAAEAYIEAMRLNPDPPDLYFGFTQTGVHSYYEKLPITGKPAVIMDVRQLSTQRLPVSIVNMGHEFGHDQLRRSTPSFPQNGNEKQQFAHWLEFSSDSAAVRADGRYDLHLRFLYDELTNQPLTDYAPTPEHPTRKDRITNLLWLYTADPRFDEAQKQQMLKKLARDYAQTAYREGANPLTIYAERQRAGTPLTWNYEGWQQRQAQKVLQPDEEAIREAAEKASDRKDTQRTQERLRRKYERRDDQQRQR